MTKEEASKIISAKIECMKRETSGTDLDCNYRNCDECELCYVQGTTGEQIEALDTAIEALKAQPKFTRITIDTDERWLNRKFDVFKDRLYLNEKTMIIYVPFVSFELIAQRGGTIKRIGEEE